LNNDFVTYPCVVFALAREAMYFYKRFRPRTRIQLRQCRACVVGSAERSLLSVETGIGRKAMALALSEVLAEPRIGEARYRPQCVILAGFSGALHDDLRPGDLVLASSVVDEHGEDWPRTWRCGAKQNLQQGRVLTVDSIVAEPARKRELGRRHDALAVDMESAVAARLCHQQRVPFACLRAISDGTDIALSADLIGALSTGAPKPGKILRLVARRPAVVGELVTLARNTRLAARNLATALHELLSDEARDLEV
jgi:nucleoside phosphorylase